MTDIDAKNIAFLKELCGTGLARQLGISDQSAAGLKKIEDWNFKLLPYLFTHILFGEVARKEVLEIGLCYGMSPGG